MMSALSPVLREAVRLPTARGLKGRIFLETVLYSTATVRTPCNGLSSVAGRGGSDDNSGTLSQDDHDDLANVHGGVTAGFPFADPRDPQQHPLAPLASEEVQQRREHLEKVLVTMKAPVYKRKINADGQAFAIGSRKRSKARVWLRTGTGEILVNGRPWVDYFHRLDHRDKILKPLGLLHLTGKMDVTCEVLGGGTTGQAEALRHGISRALQNWDPLFRPTLKENGLLTRDSREVEPKKYGRKKARKAFQWVKR